jgi:hypothetical protein
MKRKKVMQLFALAIAAAVTVTSPAVPAGLTTVWAADALEGATITIDAGSGYVSFADNSTYKADSVKIKASNSSGNALYISEEESPASWSSTEYTISNNADASFSKILYFKDSTSTDENVYSKTITVNFDNTDPTISEETAGTTNATTTTVTTSVTFTSSEAGTAYYKVRTADPVSDAENIKSGATGNKSVAAGSNTISEITLTANTTNYVDIVVEDAAGNLSTVATVTIVAPALQSEAYADPTKGATLAVAGLSEDKTKYKVSITAAEATEGTIEYSIDKSDIKTIEEIQAMTFDANATLTVYARVKTDAKAASGWKESDTLTFPEATAAPTISSTVSDGKITITSSAATDTIYYTVNGTDPVIDGATPSEATLDASSGTITGTKSYTGGTTVTITILTTGEVTVKAMALAEKDTNILSSVASQTFNKVESEKKEDDSKKEDNSGKDSNKDDSSKNEGSTDGSTAKAEIEEAADGTKTIVDESGNVIADSKVTVDGKSYITDESGKVITGDKVTTEDGKTYITDADGVIETGKVSFEGNQYITGSDGAILTDKVTKTPSGNKVYVDEDGVIVKNQAVSSNGKKYYATKSGKIATNGFVKTAKGNTVYATKSGVLKVNKAFKASNGKKYVADKNGKIVKGKKITIGNKIYTTNKKGVIIKVTKKK